MAIVALPSKIDQEPGIVRWRMRIRKPFAHPATTHRNKIALD
jgi:hypothetical protein